MNCNRFLFICAVLWAVAAQAQDSLNVRRLGQLGMQSADAVVVNDNLAFVTGNYGLRIIDVSDETDPTEIGFFETIHYAFAVAVSENYVYMPNSGSLKIIDVGNPANPSQIGSFDTEAEGVAVSGIYAYVASFGGLRILDVSSPESPIQVGYCDSRGFGISVVGQIAYLSGTEYGLRIVDISNPSMPVEIGYYITSEFIHGATIAGNYAYLADSFGLIIIDINDPASPTEVGSFETEFLIEGISIHSNFAYLANSISGLRVIDVGNPAIPIEVGYYNTPGTGRGITSEEAIVYFADGNYLGIYDCSEALSTPESPIATPTNFELHSAYPNPFNAETTIGFSLPRAAQVALNVFDVNGRLVKELANETYVAGNHSLNWNASGFATGVYFVRLNGAEFSTTQKIVLLK